MGRRRTLINGFGANWATGRVSVKKCAAGQRTRWKFELSFRCAPSSWSRTSPEDHCIKSYINRGLFSDFPRSSLVSLVSLRVQFLFFSVTHASALVLPLFWKGGGRCTQRAPSVTIADSPQTRQKKKGISVMSCQRCHRGRIKPRFGEQGKKGKSAAGLDGCWPAGPRFLFTTPRKFARTSALEIPLISKVGRSANYHRFRFWCRCFPDDSSSEIFFIIGFDVCRKSF